MKLTHILLQLLSEKKEDRCKRIADRRYDKPSAYKSGAIVRCRQGKIWKNLKEELNELNMPKFIRSWVNTADFKKPNNFPESIFLYLKRNGYTNKGEIYRVLDLNPLIVIIKQNTEYIDLDKFLEKTQDDEFYDNLYDSFKHEKEVIARLDPNFSFEYIHYTNNTGLNIDKNKLRQIILKKDQGKLLSFTKDKSSAHNYLESIQKWKKEYISEDESLHKWFKRKGAPGKEGGWVDCNTCRNGKCKSCGRKEGESRAKYPSCRPTPAQCKTKGKGKKWGKTK